MDTFDDAVWLSPTIAKQITSIAARLAERGQTLSIVECTIGGAIGHLLTNVPGASAWFLGGIAPYSARFKERALGLSPSDFAEHGAVSPEAARLLATSMRERSGADWIVAETGLAGPRGQHRSSKPTGTIFICVIDPSGQSFDYVHYTGVDNRLANKKAFIGNVVDILDVSISK